MKAVLRNLEKIDPAAAQRARERYACFDQFGEDTQVYQFMTGLNLSKSCEEQVVQQLVELRNRSNDTRRSGRITEDETFYAEQNARLVKNAEAYYRTMFLKEESSWNLRDRHMVETLEALVNYLGHQRNPVKMVVWAHNSHLGDARATEMGQRGELNVGQLVREQYDGEAVLVGFTTHHGTVTAASAWDGPAERKRVRPALAGSYEALFHAAHPSPFLLSWRDDVAALSQTSGSSAQSASCTDPIRERMSHYCTARLPDQFDVVLHFDETHAVEPLETTAQWEAGEVPETFPVRGLGAVQRRKFWGRSEQTEWHSKSIAKSDSSPKRRSRRAASGAQAESKSLSFKSTSPVGCITTSGWRSMVFWYHGPCPKGLP